MLLHTLQNAKSPFFMQRTFAPNIQKNNPRHIFLSMIYIFRTSPNHCDIVEQKKSGWLCSEFNVLEVRNDKLLFISVIIFPCKNYGV